MAKVCFVCNKRPQVANLVSHANNKTKRWVYPNVQKIRFTLNSKADNKVIQSNVCTKCVKAKKIRKVL